MLPADPDGSGGRYSPRSLRSGEQILHHWTSPGGEGVLTNLRCLLLGHPHPLHRFVHLSIDLDQITELSVEVARGISFLGDTSRMVFGGGETEGGGFDPSHAVLVNEIPVYIGYPNVCANVQAWVDSARTAACLALHGRLLPYTPPPTRLDASEGDRGGQDPALGSLPSTGPDLGGTSGYTLFLPGVPWRDAGPRKVAGTSVGFAFGAVFVPNAPGGHEPADFRPGQVYGWEAEVGRLVLDIASSLGVTVRAVDVDRPANDLELVRRSVGPDTELPLLVSPDGRRLEGDGAFTPQAVERFLRGA
jgi:hypothetical protein